MVQTPIKTGRFKELFQLFLPILLMTFSNYLFLLVEKVFLARYSVQAMEAAVSAAYALQITQIPSVAIALMAQVFVGRWNGSQEQKLIGPGIWQFLWFSCLSIVVSLPFNLIFGSFYFQGTNIEGIVWPYYIFLSSVNFLFPLGTTLTCFYFGLGKTRLVLFTTIGSQILKLLFAYAFIFGIGVPSFGLLGGAASTLLAQSGFCAVLLWVFLKNKHAEDYSSRLWKFQPKLFWECIHPGLLRALSRISMLLCWAAITYLMTSRGDEYLLVLSVGGTISLFLPFLADAICQAQITIVSNILGARNYHLLKQAFYSGLTLVIITIALLAIPLIVFPIPVFQYVFPRVILDDAAIKTVLAGVWSCYAFFSFAFLPISHILAFKDTRFMFYMGAFNWVNGYLVMYVAVEWIHIRADMFWLVLTIMHASMAFLYYFRMRWLQSRIMPILAEAK